MARDPSSPSRGRLPLQPHLPFVRTVRNKISYPALVAVRPASTPLGAFPIIIGDFEGSRLRVLPILKQHASLHSLPFRVHSQQMLTRRPRILIIIKKSGIDNEAGFRLPCSRPLSIISCTFPGLPPKDPATQWRFQSIYKHLRCCPGMLSSSGLSSPELASHPPHTHN